MVDNLMSYKTQDSVLAVLRGADLNTTADQLITINSSKFIIRRIVVTNASSTPSIAVGGIYTQVGKAGSQVVTASQVYSSLNSTSKFLDLTLETAATTTVFTSNAIYLSLTVAAGSALTADIYVMGDDLNG